MGTKEVILGLVAHATYYQLLRDFPLVALMSVKFIASVGMSRKGRGGGGGGWGEGSRVERGRKRKEER